MKLFDVLKYGGQNVKSKGNAIFIGFIFTDYFRQPLFAYYFLFDNTSFFIRPIINE